MIIYDHYLIRVNTWRPVKVVHNWQQNMVRTFWSRLLEPPFMVVHVSVHELQSMVVSRFHASVMIVNVSRVCPHMT